MDPLFSVASTITARWRNWPYHGRLGFHAQASREPAVGWVIPLRFMCSRTCALQTNLAHGGCAMTTIVNREGGDYDVVIVGGGQGGLTAATTAAAGGHRVAMTEQRLTGGTCVNFGCTPSKALIRCARAVHDAG